MSKPVKEMMAREYEGRYGQVNTACVVSVIGLDAISTNRLRGELRARNLRLQVMKNSLAQRAFAGTPLSPLCEAFEGPCALVTGEGSAIDIAKVLVGLQKTYPKIELRVGILDGDAELISVEQLAGMKGRLELLGEVAGIVRAPGAGLAGCLAGPAGRIAGCLKAMAEEAEEAEPTATQA